MIPNFFQRKQTKWTVVAGLGNPGREYAHTRHNVGFDTIDIMADRFDIPIDVGKFNAYMGKGEIEGKKVILVKPQTYMNLSGESLSKIVSYYKVNIEEALILIYDDIYLDVGHIRIRKKGSAGGHNGMKNIIKLLSSEDFSRIRIGVGEKPKGYDLKDYVTGHFSDHDRELIDEGLIKAAEAVRIILKEGCDMAMNRYNVKEKGAQ